MSSAPLRSKTTTAAQEPSPSTEPPAADSSTAASTETTTTSANSKRGQGSSNRRGSTPRNPQDPKGSPQEPKGRPRKGPEKQQDSTREQSNVEESLMDATNDPIEVDDDFVGVEPDYINGGEEQRERLSSNGRSSKPLGGKSSSAYTSSSHRPVSRHVRDRERLADLTQIYKEQAAKLLEAEGTIREKDEHINTLTETITRLHLRDGGVSRDDNYFTTQFSDITNSITEWTVTFFKKSDWEMISDLDSLPIELVQMVKSAAYDSTNILKSVKSRREVINAMVINTLYHCLFGPFLFGAPEAGNSLRVVGPQLQGTDFQIQRWRALTINLLAQGPIYERRYNEDVSAVAQSLGSMLAHLAPVESDADSRNAGLHKIVSCAAALSVEIRKQSDLIWLVPALPGMIFNTETMEDLNCEYEVEELDGKAVVQIPIFPAIMRKSCKPSGNPDKEHNLMKAKVTTMFVNK